MNVISELKEELKKISSWPWDISHEPIKSGNYSLGIVPLVQKDGGVIAGVSAGRRKKRVTKKNVGGVSACGANRWIQHVKAYQKKHGWACPFCENEMGID